MFSVLLYLRCAVLTLLHSPGSGKVNSLFSHHWDYCWYLCLATWGVCMHFEVAPPLGVVWLLLSKLKLSNNSIKYLSLRVGVIYKPKFMNNYFEIVNNFS